MPEALPLPWVQRIMQRLLVRYGSRFTSAYAGVEDADLWADWAEQLAGTSPEAIQHALQHLPTDAPPNAAQFAALCRRAPAAPMKALPMPDAKPNPVVLQKVKDSMANASANPLAWAHALARKEAWQDEHPREVGQRERLTPAQRSAWREALRLPRSIRAADALSRGAQ